MSLADWVESKLAIAASLNDGHCGAGYPEACLVVSSILSGLASELWPGCRIDRQRFVEVWVTYSDPALFASHVSVPLLLAHLEASAQPAEAAILRGTHRAFSFWQSTLLVTGKDVDRAEGDILSLCPSLSRRAVRDQSYPILFYRHVRSAYVHEYEMDLYGKASGRAWDPHATAVEYGNLSAKNAATLRQIHFPLLWLSRVVRSIATRLSNVLPDARPPRPSHWWIDGYPTAGRA
jgi:hypothetical protein